jgi:tRNA dimethylallyltransferase
VRLARAFGGEIISADSRQVYRGLNIGSGKDLAEYEIDGVKVPYHLIDIVDLDREFSVFDYQQRFYAAFEELSGRGVMPVIVGGTGLYIEAALKKYRMVEVPENGPLREELSKIPHEALVARLTQLRGGLHNITDTSDQARLVRAIEIAEYSRQHEPEPAPDIRVFVLGTLWEREVLRERISIRLKERLRMGMIEEVRDLHESGVPWPRLETLGLEYRFISEYLQGKIRGKNDLFQKLYIAICQFAKRQDTWFRRMERGGIQIHWVPQGDYEKAREIMLTASFSPTSH